MVRGRWGKPNTGKDRSDPDSDPDADEASGIR
jgi:hypothetical protein